MTTHGEEAAQQPAMVTPAQRHIGLPMAVLGSAAMAACGGGGGPSETTVVVKPATLPTTPQAQQAAAARFLAQAGLGATPASIGNLLDLKLDYNAWLDAQFAMPARTAGSATLDGTTAWQLCASAGFTDMAFQSSDWGLDNVLWYRLFSAQDVLRQRVVLALSEIFVVSVRNLPVPWGQFLCLAYWDLLEQHAFGTFRELIEAITLSPAMGVYLSMRGSQKGDDTTGRRPDENYARELLQLFTIGLLYLDDAGQPTTNAQGLRETYTNEDVTQLAKALTGWDFDPTDLPGGVPTYDARTTPAYTARPMLAKADWHDTSEKTVLGVKIPANGTASDDLKLVLDTICAHPNVGPFIARQLIQRLVSSNPEPEHIRRVVAVFNDNGHKVRGDMKAVIRAVLTDPLARGDLTGDQAVRRCKLREPILRFVQWGRLVKLSSTAPMDPTKPKDIWAIGDLSASSRLAQSPMRSPSVFNFFRPGYVPLNTGISADGFVAPEFQITDESSVIGYANFMLQHINGAPDQQIVVDYSDWLTLADDPVKLVDQLDLLLTGRVLADVTRQRIVAAINTIPTDVANRPNRVQAAFFLMLTSPDYLVQR